MIECYRADGFEIAFENRVRNDSTKTLPRKIGKAGADSVRPARDVGKSDEGNFCLALACQHPHQVGIVHQIERVILPLAFIERSRAMIGPMFPASVESKVEQILNST